MGAEMSAPTNDRALREQGAAQFNSDIVTRNSTGTAPRIKALIVAAAVWGFIPANCATWLLLRLGLVSE